MSDIFSAVLSEKEMAELKELIAAFMALSKNDKILLKNSADTLLLSQKMSA